MRSVKEHRMTAAMKPLWTVSRILLGFLPFIARSLDDTQHSVNGTCRRPRHVNRAAESRR